MSNEGIFLRNASGLVKTAGAWELFVFNLGLISVGIAVTLMHFYVPANYPGASLPAAELLAGLLMGCIAFAFWAWTVTIPRSGGIYAFVSRGMNPTIGFTVSFVDSLTWLFYNALAASYVTAIGLAPGLFVYGQLTENKNLVNLAITLNEPIAQFVIGCLAIAISTILIVVGMRAFFRVQSAILLIALAGSVIAIAVLSGAVPGEVQSTFVNAFQGVASKVSDLSKIAPTTSAPVSPTATALALVWPLLSFVGCIFSINIGGEVQQARRSQAIGIFGSIAFAVILLMVLSYLGDRAFGLEFQASVGKMHADDPLPLPPYFSLLAALATKSPLLALAICTGFLAWAFLWIPATLVYSARAFMAWSFDRVAPSWLGYVHDRFHTPVNALVTAAILNVVFLALFLFSTFFGTLVLVLAAMIAWIPTMIAAILFPYLRPHLYNGTPLAAKHPLGLPYLTIAGTVGLIATLIIFWMLLNDPIAAGDDAKTISVIGGLFASGLIWFLVANIVRRKQGLSLARAYQEIPIE
jgi:amino acid transporter